MPVKQSNKNIMGKHIKLTRKANKLITDALIRCFLLLASAAIAMPAEDTLGSIISANTSLPFNTGSASCPLAKNISIEINTNPQKGNTELYR